MNYLFLYSIFDTLALIFSLLVAMVFNKFSQLQPLIFLIAFLASQAILYYLWFKVKRKLPFPYLPIAIHSICLVAVLPFVIATANFLLLRLPNHLFWFGGAPLVTLITSYIIHYFYKLPQ